jgi:TRAP-type C4-dicarboxylate transport system permease small subunit
MDRPRAPDPETPASDAVESLFQEEEITLSDLNWSDGLVLAVFWGLAFVVFLQFFTRYVLNDSLGWTEEIARFLLIGVTFIGAVMATRKQSHIAVEFLYRWLSRPVRKTLQTVVDLVSFVFYAGLALVSVQMAGKTHQSMVSIKLPKSIIYWGVATCFAFMALYALAALVRHWRTGTSRLIDPELHAESIRAVE